MEDFLVTILAESKKKQSPLFSPLLSVNGNSAGVSGNLIVSEIVKHYESAS